MTGVLKIAAAVRGRQMRAVDIAGEALKRIEARDEGINAATRLLAERAIVEARRVDEKVAAGMDPGPLAGVPYGVKDLFDVVGLPTTAGAGMRREAPAVTEDAEAIRRLSAAGAVLVATLNMDEYAYGFVTDNAHWGITRNPHDTARFAGGSSGGSAAAVASGMLPFTLGSDTNGSIRIPASLCGIYGLKPSHGSLPMAGAYPFVESLDDIGPFAGSAADLAAVDAVLRGDGETPAPPSRIAMLGGWFQRNIAPEMSAALDRLSAALGGLETVELPQVAQARSAAFLMTGYEGGQFHLPELRTRALEFDAATRDRLIAGAALPRAAYDEAEAFRAVFRGHAAAAFAQHDVLIAPVVYGPAPLIDDPVIPIDGKPAPARANLGLYTQPLSYIGLPVIAAPLADVLGMPLGVQLIAAPGGDRMLMALAAELEAKGLIAARIG